MRFRGRPEQSVTQAYRQASSRRTHQGIVVRGLIALLALFALTSVASAAPADHLKRRLCIWDIMGQNGEVFARMKDYQIKASTLGIDFDLIGYVDERVASEDFRVRYCDAVVMTGLRVRPFNAFMGSVEAIGAIPSYDHMKTLITVVSSPAAASLMKTEFDKQQYEVAGVMPFGAAYGFVNDRSINSPEQLPGKKIAIFDYDKAEAKLVRNLGAQSDPSDVTNFAGKFNNGKVDIVISPATAYRPLELYRGLGKNGGVVDYVLAQVSLQVVIHADRFPPTFGQASREYVASKYDTYLKTVKDYESEVDPKYWVRITEGARARYQDMARTSRIDLINDGIYDKKMLGVLKKIRCQKTPTLAECSLSAE